MQEARPSSGSFQDGQTDVEKHHDVTQNAVGATIDVTIVT
jgi:hypothetical protein